MRVLLLPEKENLFKPAEDDSLDLYFTPLVRRIYLGRFRIAISLMGSRKYKSLLEIGFGSGIFLKELSRHTERLYGVDIHQNVDKVLRTADREGFYADLACANMFCLPYAESQFQCIVLMSVLEHITDFNAAFCEILRVADNDADIILGFPVKNPITDTFFLTLGYPPKDIHPSTHKDILKLLPRYFKVIKIIKYPHFLPLGLGLYVVVKCKKILI